MTLHKEIHFETEICEHLDVNGWLYSQNDTASYDRARALFPDDVLAWVQTIQPKSWDALEKNHGAQAADVLLNRLRDSINQRGTLDVLRHGIELLGLRQPLTLAQFKPALAMNPDILAKYAANRLRVVRQLRYSLHNENAIDLGLFLNGIPVATAELKTDFTQSIEDAVDQYRYDRDPRPKGQGSAEPLLSFPNGALVHFAVSNMEVRMTTRLAGAGTSFCRLIGATTVQRATRPMNRTATAPLIFGKTSGRGIVGWKFWVVIWWLKRTAKNSLKKSSFRVFTNWMLPVNCWLRCWQKGRAVNT